MSVEVPEGLLEYFPAILPMDAGAVAGRGAEGVPGAVSADTAGIAGSAGIAGIAGIAGSGGGAGGALGPLDRPAMPGVLGDGGVGFLHGPADSSLPHVLPHGVPHGVPHSLSRHNGPGFQRLATLDLAGNRLGVEEGMLAALVELVCGLSSLTELDLAGNVMLLALPCLHPPGPFHL